MKRVIVPCLLAIATVARPAGAEPPLQPGAGITQSAQATVQEAIRQSTSSPLAVHPPAATAETAAAQQGAPVAQQPPTSARRRRGSMVGYIDDGTIESRVRIRFDSAYQNTAPDRAEFFYAKCGCYRDLPQSNPAYDPDAPGPRNGAANDVNFQHLFLEGEVALHPRLSAFGALPLRWLQPQSFVSGTGPGFPNQQD